MGSAALHPGHPLPPTPPRHMWGEGPFAHVPPRGHRKPLKTSRPWPGGGWSRTAQGNRPAGAGGQDFGYSPSASIPPPPAGAMDGARRHRPLAGSVAVGRRWEMLRCCLRHEAEPATNLRQSARGDCDFPVPPVGDTSPHDGTEFPVIRSFPYRLLAWTRADRSAPGSASAKPTNTQKHAGSQSMGDALPAGTSQGPAPSHPSVASSLAGTISRPGHEPVISFFSLWSQDSGFTDSLHKKNSGKADKAAPRLSPPMVLTVLPRDERLPVPGESPLSPPTAILRALCTAFRELPAGFSLPSYAPCRLHPSAPDGRTLAAFQRVGLPGFFS